MRRPRGAGTETERAVAAGDSPGGEVLHLITGLNRGGAERMLYELASRTHGRNGWRQRVVSLMPGGAYATALRDAGVPVTSLDIGGAAGGPRGLVRLVRLLRADPPDLLMTWLYHADLLGTVAAAVAGFRPVLWNIRCSDMDLSKYARTTRWSVNALVRVSSRPWAVAANSEAGRIAHEKIGYRPARWAVLPNGVDVQLWRPDSQDRAAVRAELGIAADEVAVVMAARVDPKKDHAGLLAALEQVAERPEGAYMRPVLIGRGTERLSIPSRLRARTVVLGERPDVQRLLRGCDIAVLSSAFGEGFPNVVAESMATGLPCVVTDVGDAARIVGETGIVVPPRDSNALAQGITRLLSEGVVARAVRGASARTRISAEWSMEAAVQRYWDLWGTTLAEQRRRS